ncbi:branched-chain amino acid ABC transporter substrate-binding protein [Actinomadura madurae]|nr:branched-chain amino acid ABC transporter substrate-binding protein [Actinomadura madurae]MCP9964254.1 branched-chain amino acid ABC transporter substrate-binding protein [Actinomadura madurae]
MTLLTPRDRGRRFRLIATAGAGLLLAPLAASCGSGDSGGDGAIKIGVPAPLSGDSASAGQDILAAAKVAADEINKAGGVDGRKIEIVEADDQCSAQQGAQAAQKLLNSGVVAVAGGYCSGAAVPAIPIYGRRDVPFVMDASTNPSLTDSGKGKVFRTCGRDDNQGLVAAKFMTGPLGAKRVALLHDNTTYAKGLADAAASSVKQAGAQVVYEDALQPGQSDYSPVLTKVASTKPDVLYFTGYFAEAGLLMKQRKQLGLTFTLMGGDATTDSTVLKTAARRPTATSPRPRRWPRTCRPPRRSSRRTSRPTTPTPGRSRCTSTTRSRSSRRPSTTPARPRAPPSPRPSTRSRTSRASPGRSRSTTRATGPTPSTSPCRSRTEGSPPTRNSTRAAPPGWTPRPPDRAQPNGVP